MSEEAGPYRTPYAPAPGSSTPSPHVGPAEGKSELWAFFWLSLANTAIIAAAGIGAWLLIR